MNPWFAARWRRLLSRIENADPLRLVVLGYVSYIALGWLALCLPVCRHDGGAASLLDHLFISTSAVSTTGLTTVSVADTYTGWGELVVALLIQLGGLGYMTLGSCVMMAVSGGRLSPLRTRIGGIALALPPEMDVRRLVRLIVLFTLAAETAGAAVLYAGVFAPRHVPDAAWQAVFHSISAFCTAGFGLFNDSFESYRGDLTLNTTLTVLSLLGAIGFLVVNDAWQSMRHRRLHVTLTTKIILTSTVGILGAGTILFFFDEPAIQALPFGERAMAALFQVMSAGTTVGFDTVPIGSLSASSLFLLMLVMMVGASPAGTGGGIKTTTITALWAVMMSAFRRRQSATFLGREIPPARIRVATASILLYCLTLAAGIYALALVESSPFADQLFECVSALGTVGLSRGITGGLTTAGKWILTALMFVGRAGPLALGMACFTSTPESAAPLPQEDVVV